MVIKKIGLFGGSFDPVHVAHIALAETACQVLQLDELQLIPAANPWQRKPLIASASHRLSMLNLAIHARPKLSVNPLEIERGGHSYTIDTLEALPKTAQYSWLMGADQLVNFCTWHRWKDITQLAQLIVAQRPGSALEVPTELAQHLINTGSHIKELPFQPMPISASDIRQRLAQGQPVDGLLDVAVAQYIQQNHLYQPPAASTLAV